VTAEMLREIGLRPECQELSLSELKQYIMTTATREYRYSHYLNHLERNADSASRAIILSRAFRLVDVDAVKKGILNAFEKTGYKRMRLDELREKMKDEKGGSCISSIDNANLTRILDADKAVFYKVAERRWKVHEQHQKRKT